MDDTGEIVFVQGVQGVFHPPQRFRTGPMPTTATALVCISRDIARKTSHSRCAALNTPAGTQAVYSM